MTIFVVFVVCGDSSNCSMHLSLIRRFSNLYAYFYNIDSIFWLLLSMFYVVSVFDCVYLVCWSYYNCIYYLMYFSIFFVIASSYSLYFFFQSSSMAYMVSALTVNYLVLVVVRVSIVLFWSSFC